MAHIAVSPPVGSSNFSPVSDLFVRTSKDGDVPVVVYLLGSHYNSRIDGEMAVTASGNITNDSASAIAGVLTIALESLDGSTVTKQAAFTPFMYFQPGVKLFGNLANEDASLATGIEKIEYIFEDLATNDKLIIRLIVGASVNTIKLIEVVDGSESELASQDLASTRKEINFEFDFVSEGINNFYIQEVPSGTKTRIYNGVLNANIAECKVTCIATTDRQSTKTCTSEFLWILYPNLFLSYDVSLTNRILGRVRVFDDENEVSEDDWSEVYAGDTKFNGTRVIENGIIRIKILSDPAIEVFGWDGSAWQTIDKITPITSVGDLANTLQDVVFDIFNPAETKFTVKFGVVNFVCSIRRGMPFIRIYANSKKMRVDTTKERFALSTGDPATNLTDFNQKTTDDANKGNPLNLSPTVNPYNFTNDSTALTGLLHLDDNWFAWYNVAATDMVGFLGTFKRPTGLKVVATSSSVLDYIEWSFDTNAIIIVGILKSTTNAPINGVPTPFISGGLDNSVKWRANEGIFTADQRIFLKRKR